MRAGQVCTLKGIYWRENVDGSNRLWVAGWRLEFKPICPAHSGRKGSTCGAPFHCINFCFIAERSSLPKSLWQLFDIRGEDYVVFVVGFFFLSMSLHFVCKVQTSYMIYIHRWTERHEPIFHTLFISKYNLFCIVTYL